MWHMLPIKREKGRGGEDVRSDRKKMSWWARHYIPSSLLRARDWWAPTYHQWPMGTVMDFKKSRKLTSLSTRVFVFFVFFPNFVMWPKWWSSTRISITRFGYRPDMKVEILKNPFLFWLPCGIRYTSEKIVEFTLKKIM
jgi:hypothetical protein